MSTHYPGSAKHVERVKRDRAHLIRARQLLDDYGWVQREWRAVNGALCLEGAVNMAAFGIAAPSDKIQPASAILRLGREIREQYPHCLYMEPHAWNDMRSRTREDVFYLIDATVARIDVWLSEHDVPGDGGPVWEEAALAVNEAEWQNAYLPKIKLDAITSAWENVPELVLG